MAKLVINEDTVTIAMSALEKAEALHRDLTFPRSAVTDVQVVANAMQEVHGLRLPGTSLPGVVLVGSFVSRDAHTFAVCHGDGPGIVISVTGQHYDRVVMTTDNAEMLAEGLR
jgi:hypothetical protein